MLRQNWFNTLNESLASEGLIEQWPLGTNIQYGETKRIITDNFIHISVFRNEQGRYERPVHYSTN